MHHYGVRREWPLGYAYQMDTGQPLTPIRGPCKIREREDHKPLSRHRTTLMTRARGIPSKPHQNQFIRTTATDKDLKPHSGSPNSFEGKTSYLFVWLE